MWHITTTAKCEDNMKRDAIKVGQKTGTKFDIQYNRPENAADCAAIAKNDAKLAAFFNRGYTIWLQDAIARPMFAAGESKEAIQAAVDASDPTVTKARRAPLAPQVVTLAKGKKSYSAEEVAAMLAGLKGVTIA
jgi:hypothetical protein